MKTLPVEVPPGQWRPLRHSEDKPLLERLKVLIGQKKEWLALIKDKKMAMGLVDLTSPGTPRFASINGQEMMYAASLPKIAILLAVFQSFHDGTVKESPELIATLTRMIRVSNNSCATEMIDLVGYKKIEKVLRDPKYELFDEKRGGGLWVGKRFAKKGNRYPDPLKGLSHAATVNQVCRFYYLLATGKLIDARRSRQMLDILSKPAIHHKFVKALETRAPHAQLFRKSGSWRTWHSDSVLVWGPQRRYILVGLLEAEKGGSILRELVTVAESALSITGKK
jgi:beta-lactamase class A